ncbi:hypothetical protein GF312_19100 [Candidatus Poribacteria bacterium]|nr:hypothetical protein [Candidatus Poribacteria bacterium]
MTMKKTFCLITLAFLVIITCTSTLAQSQPKIAAVDTEKALEDSIWGKKAIEEMEKDRDAWEQRVKDLNDEIAELEANLAKQKAFLEDTEKEKELQSEIANKKQGRELLIQQGNAQLSERQQEILEPILEEMKNTIKKLSIDEGYDLVLEKRLIVLYLNPEFDLTSKVTSMLDDAYKQHSSSKASTTQKDSDSSDKESQKEETKSN